MRINLILIPFVIILGLLFSQNDTKKSRQWYIIICSAILLFIASMRSPEWMTNMYGIDSNNYKYTFAKSYDMSWDEVWTTALIRYFGDGEDSDIGYWALNKIIGYITHDFAIFSLLADLLFFVPFGILLYRFSTRMTGIIFAFVYYISLIQVFLLGGGRQMFAIGLDMMALIAVIDRKKIRAIIFFLIGITFHFSSFLFLAPLLMVWYDAKPKTLKLIHIICFIVFPLVLLMPGQLISFMGTAVGSEKYAEYGNKAIVGAGNVFIVLMEFLSLFCLMAIKKKDMLKDQKLAIFYVMLPFMTLFAPLIRANGTMIRIPLYYSIFLTLLVPFGIDCFLKKNKTIGYVVAIGALSLLALAGGGMTYYFYWQV